MSNQEGSDDSIIFIPISAATTPPAPGEDSTSTNVDVQADPPAASATSATAKFAAAATPAAPVTNMVNILYVGVNIASVVENGDNGAATKKTISFENGDAQLGTILKFPPGTRKSTRNLTLVLADPTQPGSVVMIASGQGKQVPHTINAKVPPKSK